MKSNTFSNTEDVSETDTQRFHVPLHQITGKILHKYTDNRGNSAYLVQQQTENGTPLFSVECILYQNGVFQHYFVTHTTNDDPTHLPHYLSKTLSNA
jgi:hypothetical protein